MADGALPELKNQIEGFHKTLQGIREKQDDLDKELKKRGAADPLTKAALEKIEKAHDKLRDDINALHRKANRPAVAQLDAKSSKLETKANREFGRWLGLDDEVKAAAQRALYAKAQDKYLRWGEKGSQISAEEVKALSVGSAPDGGFFVEPYRAQTLIDKLYETSDVRALAAAISINSNSFREPIDRDEAATGWVGEQSTRSETNTPATGFLEIPVHEQYALPKATQNLLDDAGINVEEWLDGKVADEIGRQENTAFVTGNGVNKPKGFTSYTTAATADASRTFGELEHIVTGANGAWPTASATVNPADKLYDLIYKFKRGYRRNLVWAGNRLTLGSVRKFKDQDGNYNIYHPQVTPQQGIIDTVLGYRWEEMSDMADYTTTGALAVALADWKRAYLIVDRQGIRQLRDPYTSKGFVLFYTTKRVGGGVRDSDAMKFLKFSA